MIEAQAQLSLMCVIRLLWGWVRRERDGHVMHSSWKSYVRGQTRTTVAALAADFVILLHYLDFLSPPVASSKPCSISCPNTYIMYNGKTSHRPLPKKLVLCLIEDWVTYFGMIHKKTKLRKSL